VGGLVEIMGHTKVAGRVTTRKVGVNVMFQVDVPKGDEKEFSHSRLFSPAAVFSIIPTTEEWCRRWAKAAKDYRVGRGLGKRRRLKGTKCLKDKRSACSIVRSSVP